LVKEIIKAYDRANNIDKPKKDEPAK
jgi:hypothetical protein